MGIRDENSARSNGVGGRARAAAGVRHLSLSVDLQPLRSADEVATLLLSLRRYPDGLPNRLEKVADDLGGTYSVEQLTGLLERLVARSAGFMLLSSSLPPDGPTVYLIPPVVRGLLGSAAACGPA